MIRAAAELAPLELTLSLAFAGVSVSAAAATAAADVGSSILLPVFSFLVFNSGSSL